MNNGELHYAVVMLISRGEPGAGILRTENGHYFWYNKGEARYHRIGQSDQRSWGAMRLSFRPVYRYEDLPEATRDRDRWKLLTAHGKQTWLWHVERQILHPIPKPFVVTDEMLEQYEIDKLQNEPPIDEVY